MRVGPEKDLHLLDYWQILVKRRWVVYTALLLVTTTVLLGSLLMQPVYTATTRLQIEQNTPDILPFKDIMASVPDPRNDFYQTQYGLIQSRRVAGDVIEALRLAALPEFKVRASAARAGADAVAQAEEVKRIDLFLKRLRVAPVRNSRLVDISFSSHDPLLAATVSNRVAETYIAFNSEVQYNTTTRATTSLTHQVASLQEDIDTKEKELQAYARQNGIIPLGDHQDITLKNLNDLSDSYTRARAARIESEARCAALRESDPGQLPEVLESRLIQDLTAKSAELSRQYDQMLERFKPDWPQMVRLKRELESNDTRLAIERSAIYQQVKGVAEGAYRAARNQETDLKKALDEQKHQSQEFNLREIEYNNLKAEVSNRRATLEALLKRQTETSSSASLNDLASSNVRIVDAAETPVRPSSPRIVLNLFLGLFTGLALGLGLTFFFEYMDKSVKTPEEMAEFSGIPSIGLVPALQTEGTRLRVIRSGAEAQETVPVETITHSDPKSKISEAFREVRTALLVSQPGRPPRSIMVASAQPGEGKTAVSVNLAITLAQIGRRVLLVDADLRKPRLHKILGLANDQGLSHLLCGTGAPWPEPRPTGIPGLDVITSGPLPPNPADLLDSDRFDHVLRELEARGYDHILYDSPPILAVADPAIMAGRLEAVILVVHGTVTSKDALAHAAARLRQVRARTVGAILNRIDLDQQSYYYGYTYRRYYGEEDAGDRPASPDLRGRNQPTASV